MHLEILPKSFYLCVLFTEKETDANHYRTLGIQYIDTPWMRISSNPAVFKIIEHLLISVSYLCWQAGRGFISANQNALRKHIDASRISNLCLCIQVCVCVYIKHSDEKM